MRIKRTYHKIGDASGFESGIGLVGQSVLWQVYPPQGTQKEIDRDHFLHIRDRKIVQGPIFDDLPKELQEELVREYPYATTDSVKNSLTHVSGDFRTNLRDAGLTEEDTLIGQKGLSEARKTQEKYGNKIKTKKPNRPEKGAKNEPSETV